MSIVKYYIHVRHISVSSIYLSYFSGVVVGRVVSRVFDAIIQQTVDDAMTAAEKQIEVGKTFLHENIIKSYSALVSNIACREILFEIDR